MPERKSFFSFYESVELQFPAVEKALRELSNQTRAMAFLAAADLCVVGKYDSLTVSA